MISLFTDIMRGLFTPFAAPPPTPKPPVPELPNDGRCFAWVRALGASKGSVQPVVLFDEGVGAKPDIVGPTRLLKPCEYGDSLNELAARYPAPKEAS